LARRVGFVSTRGDIDRMIETLQLLRYVPAEFDFVRLRTFGVSFLSFAMMKGKSNEYRRLRNRTAVELIVFEVDRGKPRVGQPLLRIMCSNSGKQI